MLKYVFHSEGERAAQRISWYKLWLISHFHRKRRSQLGMISRHEKEAAKWDCYGIMGELSFQCQRAIWNLQNTSRYKFVCFLSPSLPSPFLPPTSCLLSLLGSHVPRMTLNAASASQVLWLHMWFYGMLGRDPRPSHVCRQVFSKGAILPVHKYFTYFFSTSI